MLLENMVWIWSNVARIRPGMYVALLIRPIGLRHIVRRSVVLYQLVSKV